MLRSAASKVMLVGRATVFLVGLAVILALLFGVATTAFGANGNPFLLGQKNVASAISTLVNKGPGPALNLVVRAGQPPMNVNANAGKATNLNADKVDGSEGEMWAQINADGTARNWKGLIGNGKVLTGWYSLTFAHDVTDCAITPSGEVYTRIITIQHVSDHPDQVYVFTTAQDGTDQDADFDIVVFCGDHQSAP